MATGPLRMPAAGRVNRSKVFLRVQEFHERPQSDAIEFDFNIYNARCALVFLL